MIARKAAAQRVQIGPSTGWIKNKTLNKQLDIIRVSGANAIEILPDWKNFNEEPFIKKGREAFKRFTYRSLHLPDLTESNLDHIIFVANSMQEHCGITTAVLHPLKKEGVYPIWAYIKMMESGVPLAIENMDSRKHSGYDIEELSEIVYELDCGFVLDIQHAYEHDPSNQEYLRPLFYAIRRNLVHLHVSGQTADNIHARVCKADNQGSIAPATRWILDRKDVPIILEGKYETSEELREEITLLRQELAATLTS